MGGFGLEPCEHEHECHAPKHVFPGCTMGLSCLCGEKRLTVDDVREMQESPVGLLISHGLSLPIVMN